MTTRVTLDVCRPPSYLHHPESSIPFLSPFPSSIRRCSAERSQAGLVTKAVTYQGDWGCVTIDVSLVAHHLISRPKSGDLHIDHEPKVQKYMTFSKRILSSPSVEYIKRRPH